MNNRAYIGWSKRADVVEKSSSGGIFFSLSKSIIDNGGIVFGATIDENGYVFHKRVNNINELYSLLGSKYVVSDLKKCFIEVKNELVKGKEVLFSGTPCQVNALNKYLDINNIDKDNLISLDLICHGTPKKEYWDIFLNEIKCEKPYFVNFRNKIYGWENFKLSVNDYIDINNLYKNFFISNYILTDSCYKCPAKGDNRTSDITIGDAWNVKHFANEYNDKGTTLIIIHNKEDLIKQHLKEECTLFEVNMNDALKYNKSYYNSSTKPKDIYKVQKWIKRKGFLRTKKRMRWNTASLKEIKQRIIHKIYGLKYICVFKPIKRKREIGIRTLFSTYSYNYGNRLQNFALTTFLRKNGLKPINIYIHNHNGHEYCRKWYHLLKNKVIKVNLKSSAFVRADKKAHIKEKWISNTNKGIKALNRFNKIIYGGDQLWNPVWEPFELRLGKYCKPLDNIKSYSYSVSICNYLEDSEIKKKFYNNLSTYKKVSVREENAVLFLHSCGINSSLTCDPVFLLSKDEWVNYVGRYKSIELPKKSYILKYCLSNQNTVYGDDVVDILDKNHTYYSINYFDFVYLIIHAKCIITDSYHAVLFSILFNKTITLLRRKKDNVGEDRFTSIFKIVDIDYLTDSDEIEFTEQHYSKLKQLIDDSKKFIIDIIND